MKSSYVFPFTENINEWNFTFAPEYSVESK